MKARNPNLAGRIKELTKKDVIGAIFLAARGRQFTEIEATLDSYYGILEDFNKIKSGQKTKIEELLGDKSLTEEVFADHHNDIKYFLERRISEISQILLDAINSRDSKEIFEIGRAVNFLKKFKASGDSYRYLILHMKNALDRKRKKIPIRDIAKMIGWPDMSGADGFKQIRRMCKELNFPLADSRRKVKRRS
jgi:hypothetical protein